MSDQQSEKIEQLSSDLRAAKDKIASLERAVKKGRASNEALAEALGEARTERAHGQAQADEIAQQAQELVEEMADLRARLAMAEHDRDNALVAAGLRDTVPVEAPNG